MRLVDQTALNIVHRLNGAGYPAYFVGGCVRDLLLGREIHDWDIATAATPDEVQALFEACIPTGVKHGTVTVLADGKSFEVTTFRADGAYADGRHPDGVSFIRSPEEDLARRDFTVNAMAMDAQGKILDPFGGREDLEHGVLRCVGDAETRFREDALRMLRALRFMAQLGFAVHKDTMAALRHTAPLTATLSAERVCDEMEKTLLSTRPNTVVRMAELGLLTAVGVTEVARMTEVPPERTVRWAAFFAACPQADWTRLRLDRKTGEICIAATQIARGKPADRLGWKLAIAEHGIAAAFCAAGLCGARETVAEIAASGECVSLRDLAVDGGDFAGCGAQTGAILHGLLHYVLAHPEDNKRDILLALAKREV